MHHALPYTAVLIPLASVDVGAGKMSALTLYRQPPRGSDSEGFFVSTDLVGRNHWISTRKKGFKRFACWIVAG